MSTRKGIIIILLALVSLVLSKNVVLEEENFVSIRGVINGKSSSQFVTDINSKKLHSGDSLYVYISSPGGSVISGMKIVQSIASLKSKGINVKCIGDTALSMGFVIFQECSERMVLPSSVIMQHQMSLGTGGSLKNVQSYMSFISSVNENVENRQAAKLNMTRPEFDQKIAHDWWLFGNDAVENNAADQLVTVECAFKHKPVNETVYTWFGPVVLTYSNCPVAKDPIAFHFADHVKDFESANKYVIENYFTSNPKKIDSKLFWSFE